MASHDYYVDVVGGCNLQCPSCPVGHSIDAARPKGVMSEELFEQIVVKIRRDTPDAKRLGLYNWTEPTLHPRLPALIEIARKHGLRCSLSTNLNNFRNMEAVIAAAPRRIRISLSGFTQEYYGRTHRKGDIEIVKANMRALREAIDRLGADTRVEVMYHCYRDNCGDELRKMKALAGELRFEFVPMWAHLTGVEKNLDYHAGRVSPEDRAIIDLLVANPDEYRAMALRDPSPDCSLRSHETVIDVDGRVALCCSVYDTNLGAVADSFLGYSKQELQARKDAHPYCGECMANGYHDVATYTALDEWTAVAAGRIAPDPVPEFVRQKRANSIVRRLRRGVRNTLRSLWSGA